MKPNIQSASDGHLKPGRSGEPLGSNSEIGRKLKQYYDEIVSEEVPDRFADLLKQLEKREESDASREGA